MQHTSDMENSAVLRQELHVWYCNPQKIVAADVLQDFQSMLSASERKQQQKFYSKNDQHGYLVSHALVRIALSKYAEVSPQGWEFSSSDQGKPELINAHRSMGLKFNLTHTADLCACVVTRDTICGIDAEHTLRQNKLLPIARRMFASAELESLKNLNVTELRQRFFHYWTLREAFVKAKGAGLGGSSKQFHFEIPAETGSTKGARAQIRFAENVDDQAEHWQFETFQPDEQHVISVAAKTGVEHKRTRWYLLET